MAVITAFPQNLSGIPVIISNDLTVPMMDVARHMSSLPRRIIEPICVAPRFVADDNDLHPPRIELGKVWMHYLHVCDADEHSKMMYYSLLVGTRRPHVASSCRGFALAID